MPNHPTDAIDGFKAPNSIFWGHILQRALKFRAGEAQLNNQWMRHLTLRIDYSSQSLGDLLDRPWPIFTVNFPL